MPKPEPTNPGLLYCSGESIPENGTLGYATGCIFTHSSSGTYINYGTNDSCNFSSTSFGCKTKVGYFASPANVGNFSVSDLGFKPKSIEFIGSKNDGWQTWFFHSQGFADDSGHQNVSTLAGNFSNLFRGDCKFDRCIYLINTGGAVQVMGTLVSMDTDGFTLNFTAVNPVFVIRWKAIG